MKISKIILFFFILCSFAVSSFAHNPFVTKPENQHTAPTPAFKSKLPVKIITWQLQLKEKMSLLVREAKATRSIKPLFVLLITAFGYGVIHAAGPGHGKALVLTYVLSHRPSYINGLIFGNCMALFHGFSGIIFVIIVRVLLQASIMQNLETVTNITQFISYSIISLFGAGLCLYGMYQLSKIRNKKQCIERPEIKQQKIRPVFSALVVGAIPCPAVVMVMLFAMSMDLIILGIALGTAISAGMALTVSVVVILAVSGKLLSLSATSKNDARMILIENVMKMIGGFAIAFIGILFLATAI